MRNDSDVSNKTRHKQACTGSVYVLKGFYRINQITNTILILV